MPAFCLADKYITMNKPTIDQALASLGEALKSQQDQNPMSTVASFVKKMPQRALSGDHILGGKILKFSSSGITDTATIEQIAITDDVVSIKNLKVDKIRGSIKFNDSVEANTITAKEMTVDILTVKDLRAEIKFEKSESIVFSGSEVRGKGLVWSSDSVAKQLVYLGKPDRIFISESIDLGKEKSVSVGGVKVIDSTSLGSTIVKSNLKEVGRLKGLVVDGSVNINQYFFYNGTYDRLGLGTETPNAALGVADRGVEVIVGTSEKLHGIIGTYAMTNFDIVTGNTPRISVKAAGGIDLGNPNQNPSQVSVHGKLSVGVTVPDPSVDLHVAGPVRLNNKLQLSASSPPSAGTYNIGDIVWNDTPRVGKCVGWVCTMAGSPGMWYPFGEIKEQNK